MFPPSHDLQLIFNDSHAFVIADLVSLSSTSTGSRAFARENQSVGDREQDYFGLFDI